MKRSKPLKPTRKVMLWPEKKVYSIARELVQLQRVPLIKFSCSALTGKSLIFFDGEPINLN